MRLVTLENPVLLKELRIGFREKRVFFIQLGFLSFLLMTVLLAIPSIVQTNEPENLPEQGRNLFNLLVGLQALMLGLVTPGLTCGTLSGERERHSLDMVLASRLSAAEVVAGKLGFAVYYTVLLLFSSLPIASVAFFLGGVSPEEALVLYCELVLLSLLTAEIGLFYSARESRSNYSTTQAYLCMVLCLVCWPFYLWVRQLDWENIGGVWLHPMMPVLAAFFYLLAFLFLKSVHRLRPKAVNLKAMGAMFLATYWIEMAFFLALMAGVLIQTDLNDDMAALFAMFNLGHLALIGIFLNESSLDSNIEHEKFQRSWFSREMFWLANFALGMGSPILLDLALGQHESHAAVYTSCGLGIIQLFCLAVIVRGLQSLLPRGTRYSVVYFVTLAVLMILPSLGLMSDKPGLFSGVYFSPVFSVVSLWETQNVDVLGTSYTAGAVSAVAYCATAALFAVIHLVRRKR